MYRYTMWPGVYNFKDEVALFILYLKDQYRDLVTKIKRAEDTIVEQ